jgi:hypothetical protein
MVANPGRLLNIVKSNVATKNDKGVIGSGRNEQSL